MDCPCGNKLDYSKCCEPFHTGKATAPTAVQLMRSRFTAYKKCLVSYLIKTLHPSRMEPDLTDALRHTAEQYEWLSLKILDVEMGQEADKDGFVEFIALYRDNQLKKLHERSRFVKEEKHWVYVDGDSKLKFEFGRNDPCWCGSGKKLKKCHPIN